MRRLKKIMLVSVFLFIISQIFYYTNTHLKFDAISVGIETILVYVYIFLFFYEYFIRVDNEYVYNHYCFWVAIGLMIYLGGSFFVYILANHIPSNQLNQFWSLTFIAEIIKNILFAVAVLVNARQKTRQKIPNQNLPFLDFT